jgi:hypothetical protein
MFQFLQVLPNLVQFITCENKRGRERIFKEGSPCFKGIQASKQRSQSFSRGRGAPRFHRPSGLGRMLRSISPCRKVRRTSAASRGRGSSIDTSLLVLIRDATPGILREVIKLFRGKLRPWTRRWNLKGRRSGHLSSYPEVSEPHCSLIFLDKKFPLPRLELVRCEREIPINRDRVRKSVSRKYWEREDLWPFDSTPRRLH